MMQRYDYGDSIYGARMYVDEYGDYVRYEDAQQEIDRIKAKIAELKAADELYESANTGPEYSFAHQRYQEAVKELFVELEGKQL